MKTTKFATVWRQRVTVLALLTILTLALGGFMTASAQDLTATPVITTDKADYFPGETVTVMGSGWVGDTQVSLYVDDTPESPWYYAATVDVAVDGTFTWAFPLPEWFQATYTITATALHRHHRPRFRPGT